MDKVVVNGWGMGEGHSGGLDNTRAFCKFPRQLPQNMTTGMPGNWHRRIYCALRRCVSSGCYPNDGDILVTGASGGVKLAVALLAAGDFRLPPRRANSAAGRPRASSIGDRNTLSEAGKPLKQSSGRVVDAVGGNTLANACAQTRYGGVVTACGLAESAALPATVMPFTRGVILRGVDSVMAPAGSVCQRGPLARTRTWSYRDHGD